MSTSRIIYLPPAIADLESIALYIARESPDKAAAMMEKIVRRVDGLAGTIAVYQRVGWSRRR